MDVYPGAKRMSAGVCRKSGFTLLELIIVVALIGLLLVVSVPALRDSLVNDPLKSGARKLIGYIGGVRDKAVREQQAYLVYFDLDENRIWHLPEKDAGTEEKEIPEQGVLQLPADVELRDVWMRSTGSISRGIPELWVSRQGYLDQTVLHLENSDGDALSLVVSTFLPDIEVREGYYEQE
jgi:prepilin-type N-terminal cleavage/methylation domain-containing protein